LLRREGIELLGIETDAKVALSQVRALDPDIVLIEGDGKSIEATVMPALARLAYEREKLSLIRLSLPDEEMHIYYQEQRRFTDTHDLVAAIRSSVQTNHS
jgi:hypothetical protein